MRPALCLGLILAAVPARSAAPRAAVPPALRSAAALCLGEALRLCPETLADPARGASCLMHRRRLLGRTCRTLPGLTLPGLGLPVLKRPGSDGG